jgi:hypothetical protein
MGVTAHRTARFEELARGSAEGQDARAVLYGPGCTDKPWATVIVAAAIVGGGPITFQYGVTENAKALVRLSAAEVRELEAWPQVVRLFVNGVVVVTWTVANVPGRPRVRMLPGDRLTVNV